MVRLFQYPYEGGRTGESMTASRAAAPLRRPEAPQRATFLELFFDLAFVFALFQLSHELTQHLHWSGAGQTLVLLLAVWSVWTSTIWITDRLDPQWPTVQLLVIVTLLGSLVLAAALPQAFGKYGLIFAGVYIALQIGRILFVAVALRGHELQQVARRALGWCGVFALPWIGGALTHGTARGALWTLAIAVENAAYTLDFPAPWGGRVSTWEPPVAAEHFAERYRQVLIIALGELILVSGLAFSAGGFAPYRTAAFVVSVATTALLWRIYIYRAGELLPAVFAADPVSARLSRWTAYIHLAMVAGIVFTAVGNELVITHPSGRTATALAVVILGGPALFLAGRAGFEYIVFARVSRNRPIGVLVLAALTPVALHVPPLVAAAAATAVLAGCAIADAARARRRPTELPMPAARGPS
jgi:low temperature requirement protein LtrA